MKIREAMNIVLGLAEQAQIKDKDADSKELKRESLRQEQALTLVGKWAEFMISSVEAINVFQRKPSRK